MKVTARLTDTPLGHTSPRDAAMNTPVEDSKTGARPEAAFAGSPRSDLDAIARHLKRVFSEGHKTEATENPEAGCVPWYHFPVVPKQP